MSESVEDRLRRELPFFVATHECVLRELHELKKRAETLDYAEDELFQLRSENRALRAELDRYKKDREFA